MHTLFDPNRYYRLAQIIGSNKCDPPLPAVIPMSRGAWNQARKAGLIPAGRKLGLQCIAWRGDTLNAIFDSELAPAPQPMQANCAPVPPIKRPRGRPRKHPLPTAQEESAPIKRPRGRPRKHPLPTPQPDTMQA